MDPYSDHDQNDGSVFVGRGTYWKETVFEAHQGCIRIGRYCSFARRTVIIAGGEHRLDGPATWDTNYYGGDRYPLRPIGDTVIGNDVWTGDGAFIGHGAKVGNGAVIGACAVVVKDVPPFAVMVGNPAQVMRFRHPAAICDALERIAWWNWEPATIRDRIADFNRPIGDFLEKYGD